MYMSLLDNGVSLRNFLRSLEPFQIKKESRMVIDWVDYMGSVRVEAYSGSCTSLCMRRALERGHVATMQSCVMQDMIVQDRRSQFIARSCRSEISKALHITRVWDRVLVIIYLAAHRACLRAGDGREVLNSLETGHYTRSQDMNYQSGHCTASPSNWYT